MSEQRTFVVCVSFIIIFSALLTTIPTGLQGLGADAEEITPLDQSFLTGFNETANYMRDNFTGPNYAYDLNTRSWLATYNLDTFSLAAKQLIFGWLWLGGLDYVTFINSEGADRGITLSSTEIDSDAADGLAVYSLKFDVSGGSAGTWLSYWNTTAQATSSEAWTNYTLYLTHGVGFETSIGIDAGTLLFQLLFLQLPDVPLLINLIIITPIWASIVYLIWYIIKEMIPFL